MSVQIHQDSSLKVSLHDQLSRSLKAGNYQIRVANQTSQKQPIAILKTDHYQMAGTSLVIAGQVQKDASLIYLVRNYQ
ncbi:hypothetical protein ACLUX0_03395 [Limosilactobacillus mucosae]